MKVKSLNCWNRDQWRFLFSPAQLAGICAHAPLLGHHAGGLFNLDLQMKYVQPFDWRKAMGKQARVIQNSDELDELARDKPEMAELIVARLLKYIDLTQREINWRLTHN